MRALLPTLATILALSLSMPGVALAQSAEPKPEPETEAPIPEAAEKKPELSEHQKELDTLLLGAWAVVTDNIDAEMTDELFLKALNSCQTVPRITELDAEPGLKKDLPEEKDVRGEIIYFRTDQGLQRYQTKPSRVVLLPDIQRAVNAQGRTVWQVSGQFAQFSIAFADALQGADTLLMLEEDKLYLKCESQPQTDG